MTDPRRTTATAAAPQAPARHLLARTVLAAIATTLLAAGCSAASGALVSDQTPSPAQTVASALTTGQYAALGDSYTAAPGISDQVGAPVGCGRSSDSYPLLVAQRLGLDPSRIRDVSCSGATITNLTGSQGTSDGTNPAQLTALSSATTLVTLGIGGNDAHWGTVLERCAELGLIPSLIPTSGAQHSTPCQDYYTAGGTDKVQQYIQATAGPLATTLADIRHRAPNARVYVVGYPALMPASSDSACARTFAITQGDMAFLNTEEQRLNAMLRQQAAASGAAYVDTYAPSLSHDACAAPGQRWIEPWLPASPANPLHPNELGEQGMADAVVAAIKG